MSVSGIQDQVNFSTIDNTIAKSQSSKGDGAASKEDFIKVMTLPPPDGPGLDTAVAALLFEKLDDGDGVLTEEEYNISNFDALLLEAEQDVVATSLDYDTLKSNNTNTRGGEGISEYTFLESMTDPDGLNLRLKDAKALWAELQGKNLGVGDADYLDESEYSPAQLKAAMEANDIEPRGDYSVSDLTSSPIVERKDLLESVDLTSSPIVERKDLLESVDLTGQNRFDITWL